MATHGMTRHRQREISLGLATLLLSLGFVSGCASKPTPPELPKADAERLKDEFASRRIELLMRDRLRLRGIEYAISVSLAPRCGKLARPHPGVLLMEPELFEDKVLRAEVERRLDADRGIAVVGVVEGGGFDRAGIRHGDRLRRLNGRRIRSAHDFSQRMLENGQRESIAIEYERDGEVRRVAASLEAACPIRVSLIFEHSLTTYQPIRLHVKVPLELVQTAERDLLASVIAHEVAHALFDMAHETKAQQEQRADREGLLLAARAGYDVSGMVRYWEQVAIAYPWTIESNPDDGRNDGDAQSIAERWRELVSHDDIARRLPVIRKYVAGIEAQLAEADGQAVSEDTRTASEFESTTPEGQQAPP